MFLSAEPPPPLERPLPPSLLQNCVTLSNEPPQGLRANLARAWDQFDDDALEACSRQKEYRAILFALCFFHAVLQERKKFGVGNMPGACSGVGWNMGYPFSAGDLRCCAQLAANYIDASDKVCVHSYEIASYRLTPCPLVGVALPPWVELCRVLVWF